MTDNIEDALTYALYPTTGMTFLRIKHGLDPMPDEMKPRTDSDDDGAATATAAALQTDRERGPDTRVFNVYVDGAHFEVEVEPHANDSGASIQTATTPTTTVSGRRRSRRQTAEGTAPARESQSQGESASASPAAVAANEVAVVAPIPGVVLRYAVEAGQPITEGDDFVVLEAMKMENTLPAPASGTVKALVADIGATVARDAVLAVIST